MKIIILTPFLLGLLLPLKAFAYIPKFWMIMSRAAENHGKGPYRIEQDVIFQNNKLSYTIHEIWTVKNGQKMALYAVGKNSLKDKVNINFVYYRQKRYFLNESLLKVHTLDENMWFEPFFTFRYSDYIKPIMFKNNMIPKEAIKRPTHITNLAQYGIEPESFVRLIRNSGFVDYNIGISKDINQPSLWIEQDKFVIKKIRLAPEVQITAKKYKKFKKGFWFPIERTIQWKDLKVTIIVTKIHPLLDNKKTQALFSTKALKLNNSNSMIDRDQPKIIHEFYSQFR